MGYPDDRLSPTIEPRSTVAPDRGSSGTASDGAHVDVLDAIRQAWPQISAETSSRLAQAASVVRLGPGPLISEGETPARMVLVLQGTVAMMLDSPDGRRAFSGLIGPRELFGMTTLAGATLPADIDALTQVTLLTWVTQDFREIALSDQKLTVQLLDRSVDVIQRAIYLLKVRTFTTASSRLAGQLLRFEPYCFGAAPLVSRGQLGAFASVSVRMVSSIVRRWEAEGIVRRIGASGLELVDRPALEAKAASFIELLPPKPPEFGDGIAPSLVTRPYGTEVTS